MEKKITYDDTRDIAIRCVEYLIDNKYITEFEDENDWDFHFIFFRHLRLRFVILVRFHIPIS